MTLNLFKNLNKEQKKAIQHKNGPVVIFAGAGSGKTRVITCRIAYLIEQGISPEKILAVTFTNKAAKEMTDRARILDSRTKSVHISTFHSICTRWLREFAPKLGYSSNFTIYDDQDSLAILKSLSKDSIGMNKSNLIKLKNKISSVKNKGIFPDDFEKLMKSMFSDMEILIYKSYQDYLQRSNAMDFGDLILNMLKLMKKDLETKKIMRSRYKFVHVDEYQDTNFVQNDLIYEITAPDHNVMVVGDDDQSIYSWRGATPSNILNFDRKFSNSKKIILGQNYRCPNNILSAANHLISCNKSRINKKLWTKNPDITNITFKLNYDSEQEARNIAFDIKMEKSKYFYEDIAVFYRVNSQSRILEDIFLKENIAYRIYGYLKFYDRLEIKDLISYFKLIVNNFDNVSFKRIINTPNRGIGDKTVSLIEDIGNQENKSLFESIKILLNQNISKSVSKKLTDFLKMYNSILEQIKNQPMGDILKILLKETGYLDYINTKFNDQKEDKISNINELGTAMIDYQINNPKANLEDWLESISLVNKDMDDTPGVNFMTLHLAKGLEFKKVYIIGLEDGLLPHIGSFYNTQALEEERRLLYVGMTRSEEKLSLSASKMRRIRNEWISSEPSRFLKDIPKGFIDIN